MYHVHGLCLTLTITWHTSFMHRNVPQPVERKLNSVLPHKTNCVDYDRVICPMMQCARLDVPVLHHSWLLCSPYYVNTLLWTIHFGHSPTTFLLYFARCQNFILGLHVYFSIGVLVINVRFRFLVRWNFHSPNRSPLSFVHLHRSLLHQSCLPVPQTSPNYHSTVTRGGSRNY